MRKLLLMAAVAVFGLSNVNAQDENTTGGFAEGDVFATGSISFGSETFADEKLNQFTFNPSVGYFVSENIAVGVSLGYMSSKSEDGVSDDIKVSALTAGAFGQYYFTPGEQFSFLVQLTAAYTSGKTEVGDAEAKNNGFIAGFAPGISYFVSDCLALQANIGVLSYQTTKPDFDGAESTDNFNIGLNLTDINFGITYKFN
ncbi:hypothetical protein A9Q86_13145 [Flavobacteriales bacterium 33_180_T64]|nr:hypothetical protein A9Q86_13145 [Flavobacteriales bacterium 33_180_T64]